MNARERTSPTSAMTRTRTPRTVQTSEPRKRSEIAAKASNANIKTPTHRCAFEVARAGFPTRLSHDRGCAGSSIRKPKSRKARFPSLDHQVSILSSLPQGMSASRNTGLRPIKRGTGGARLRQVVTIIRIMSETLPLAQIKAHLSEIVDRVEHEHERVVLTRNGRPAAVIISPDDLEALEETLSILSDPKAMRAIRKAEADLDSGDVVTADELRAKYLQQ